MPSQKKISQKAINKNMTDFLKSSQLQDKRLNTIYGMSIEDKLHGRRRTTSQRCQTSMRITQKISQKESYR